MTLRLGYFPNVTHAPAIVGVDTGSFAETLGPDVTLEVTNFNAGGEAIEALLSGAIDATFIGPNPAINGFAQSNGEALRIVAGTTSGGASLVVAEGIDSPDDLADTTLASPALGNTQDVALRAWLAENGFATDTAGGGDVNVVNVENAEALTLFRDGGIDGAWVPEPWATRLILEGGGHVLVDERDLWPDGEFVTTHLIVATGFLEDQPEVVSGLLNGLSTRSTRSTPIRRPPSRRPTTASRRSPRTASPTRRSPVPSRTSRSPSTRSPRHCRARPTTPSPSACSTRSTSPASTT